jgi:hypothetical protein
MKIPVVEGEVFHSDIQTDRHNKSNVRFSKLCESAYKSFHQVTLCQK